MKDFKAAMRAEAERGKGGRCSVIDAWMLSNPKEAKVLEALAADFLAVRQEGSLCPYKGLQRIVERETSLKVTVNTITKWVRERYPDEPSVQI